MSLMSLSVSASLMSLCVVSVFVVSLSVFVVESVSVVSLYASVYDGASLTISQILQHTGSHFPLTQHLHLCRLLVGI
jgi:hypothetical protein